MSHPKATPEQVVALLPPFLGNILLQELFHRDATSVLPSSSLPCQDGRWQNGLVLLPSSTEVYLLTP